MVSPAPSSSFGPNFSKHESQTRTYIRYKTLEFRTSLSYKPLATEFKTSRFNDLLLFQGQILELCSSLKSIYHKIPVRMHDNDAALLSFQRLLYIDDIHRLNSKRLWFDCKDIIHINDYLILNRICNINIPSSQSGAVSASNMASASRTGGNFHPSAFIRFSVSYESNRKKVLIKLDP